MMILCLLLAIIVPPPAASPAATPVSAPAMPAAPPKTIVTVKSSPYCNSLARHFNGAFVPMYANDRTLDQVDTQLVDINELFGKPDYQARFVDARSKLLKYVDVLQKTLPTIESEIVELRKGASLTTDQAAAKAINDSADDLQRAYTKQRAMTIDLNGVAQTMMEYNTDDLPHSLGGNSYSEMTLPANEKDIKASLRFDGQRDVIAQNEEKAVDTAYDAAIANCAKQ
ncbi:MAG: hypothetical protein JO322_08475 [Candidatus Eremiobacteraeota bacterium]|nr:hypothetical protein [Candidatus Eremiobacteraeota bacterium]